MAGSTTWNGSLNGDWGNSANWSNGVPTNASGDITTFEQSPTTAITLGADQAVNRLVIGAGASAYTFGSAANALQFSNTSAGITLQYGVETAQTFNANIQAMNGNLTLRNDAISPGSLVINGDLSVGTATARSFSFLGLGGGTVNGDIVDGFPGATAAFTGISGGGRWTLAGANTYSGTSDMTVTGGSTLVLDYTSSNAAKTNAAQILNLRGSRIEILGNDSAATTTTFNGVNFNGFSVTPGATFGPMSSIHAVAGEGQNLTVNLGTLNGNTSNPRISLIRLSSEGNVTFGSTAYGSGTAQFVILNKDFGARNTVTNIIEARSDYTIHNSSISGSNSVYYSATDSVTNTGTTTFNFLGLKINTTTANQSYTTGRTLIGSTILFVGDHNYTINALGFGSTVGQHYVNVGQGALTLNGGLIGSSVKSGYGDVYLSQAATSNTFTSIIAAEGNLIVNASDVFGPTGNNANTASTQNGGTIAFFGGITLPSHTTFQIHGLGYQEGGALRNISGNNTIAGNVNLGITSKITSAAGTLTIGGNINPHDATAGANAALIFDGAGNVVVNGGIGSTNNFAYGLTKNGAGTLTLNGANAYTSGTVIAGGTLLVSSTGSLASTSVTVKNGGTFEYNNNATAYGGAVILHSGSKLTGSGRINATITGAGQVGPGNSPGVMTVATVDLSEGLDFAFELTLAGDPTWSNHTASGNDVLRLTSGSPIIGGGTSANVFSIYLGADQATYRGGIFADQDFSAALGSADFIYYQWNGTEYVALADSMVVFSVVQVPSADFAGGPAVTNGWTMQFTVVPEPSASLLGVLGLGVVLGWRKRVRNS
jgi:autotransporter-associated beta strand protein